MASSSQHPSFRDIIRNINILTSEPDEGITVDSVNDILKNIMAKFGESQNSDQTTNYFILYIRALSSQLDLFSRNCTIDEPDDVNSVKVQNDIKKAVEFLAGFGIYPLLDIGVIDFAWKKSTSDDDRKRRFINELFQLASNSATTAAGENYVRLRTLSIYVDCLFGLWNSPFKTIITASFMDYLLTGLLQLTSAYPDWDAQLVAKYHRYLSTVIEQSYRPAIIRQLISLQAKKLSPNAPGKVAAPAWLCAACGRQLSKFLIEPRGILTLIRTLDDHDVGDSSLNADWKQCESLGTLISSRPRSSDSSYYPNICRQLNDDGELLEHYSRLYVSIVRKLSTKCKKELNRSILEPVFGTFYDCFRSDSQLPSEELLSRAIDRLKLLYVSTPFDEPFSETLPLDIVWILFKILLDIGRTVSYCRTTLKEIISAYLEKARRELVLDVIRRWIIDQRSDWRSVRFICGPTGGVAVTSGSNQPSLDLEDRIEFLIETVGGLSKEFHSRLFDDCLALVLDDAHTPDNPSTSAIRKKLADHELLPILSLTLSLIDHHPNLGNANKSRMAKLLKALLEKYADNADQEDDVELESLKTQNLVLILGIIGALFSTGVWTDDEKESLSELEKALQHISIHHPKANVRSTARDISFAICTSGSSDQKRSTPTFRRPSNHHESAYQQAMKDVNDPLIPTRAHALVALINLIKSKDSETCAHLDDLIPLLLDDSYVYLASINCWAVIGLHRPNVVLPILMTLFRNAETTFDRRLKLGEAVVKISRELGDLAPFYGNDLVNIFLSLLKQGDEETKASCLSNMAEICRLMSFKLNAYIEELFHCSRQLLQWEKSHLVRRAAMNLLALLTESGDQFIEILGDLSRDFYRFVKDVYDHDEDHVVRLHAQKALENLDEHAKTFMKPLIIAMT